MERSGRKSASYDFAKKSFYFDFWWLKSALKIRKLKNWNRAFSSLGMRNIKLKFQLDPLFYVKVIRCGTPSLKMYFQVCSPETFAWVSSVSFFSSVGIEVLTKLTWSVLFQVVLSNYSEISLVYDVPFDNSQYSLYVEFPNKKSLYSSPLSSGTNL